MSALTANLAASLTLTMHFSIVLLIFEYLFSIFNNMRINNESIKNLSLSWDAVTGADGYFIYWDTNLV